MKRHVILIGLPGSGKTVVGRLVADELQGELVDVDAIIERREGRPIMMIFAERGEAAFRDMEAREMETALRNPPAIITPGGGWAAVEGRVAAAKQHGLVIYLKTRAEVAAQRVGPEGNRPVLMGGDPVERMRSLVAEREPRYLEADAVVETNRRTPQQVAAEVVRLARGGAGW